MANVGTGFSKPYVALYANTGGTNSYSSGQVLARGVEVSVEPDVVDDNNFFADNVLAESENGIVSGGQITLTVDGLDATARRLIYGLPTADGDGWVAFGNEATHPFCAIGFIYRTMMQGTTSFFPVVFPKCKFHPYGEEMATQEDQIEWQTLELVADFMRDDTASQNWKYASDTGYNTEAAAEAALKTYLSI